jgi:hypothetical protein
LNMIRHRMASTKPWRPILLVNLLEYAVGRSIYLGLFLGIGPCFVLPLYRKSPNLYRK